jgi:hypothetical protein
MCRVELWILHDMPRVEKGCWSKARTVLAHLDAGIVGPNPTSGTDINMYVYVYSMCALSYVSRGLPMS